MPLVPAHALRAESSAVQPTSAQDDTALQEAMSVLQKGHRGIKKRMGDLVVNQSALLEILSGMESATLRAMGKTPYGPEGLSEKDNALFLVAYRQEMAKLLVQILALQQATWQGDAQAFEAAYTELGSIKKAGHAVSRDF